MAAAPELRLPRSGWADDRWLASRWRRLNGPQRIAGVDLARGLAVLGMFAAHLLSITETFDWSQPATWIDVVNGRSSILFATLAGVSIGLVTGGRTPLAGADLATARFKLILRACLLWLLGLLLIATEVPVYVILPAYGILFLLAIPFVRLTARTLFIVAAALAVVMPFVQTWLDALPYWQTRAGNDAAILVGWHYPFPVWIAFVLAGLGLTRAGVSRVRVQVWALVAGAALAVVGYGLDAASSAGTRVGQSVGSAAADAPSSFWTDVWTAEPHSSGVLEAVGTGGFAIAVIAASLLVCRTIVTWIVLPLRAVGAMPLTAYTAQLLIWAAVASAVLGDAGDLTGFRELDPFWRFVIGTVVGCTAWALLIGRGPFEWVFDRASRLVETRR